MMAGRRTSLASLAGAKVDDVPGRSDLLLLSLPLDKLIPTRFNPRRRFGTDEELTEFGHKLAKKQLQPVVVVSRAAYLKLWPEEAERVGSAPYVIANGERRYRASQMVGRPTIDVVHNEDVAASRADFLDAVQSENNDRENLDPIERAIAIQTMVTELGGADRVAVYYDKTKGWVSQQRKLLKLTDELQDLVSSGEMPVRVARDIAGLPQEVQETAWEEEVARRRAAKEAAAQWRTAGAPVRTAEEQTTPKPSRFTAVNSAPADPAPASDVTPPAPERFTAVNQQGDAAATHPVPRGAEGHGLPEARTAEEAVARPATPETATPPRLPYDDGNFIGQHLIRKMPTEELVKTMRVLNEYAAQNGLEVSAPASV